MPLCRSQTAVNREGDAYVAVSLPCNAWTCEECREQRKKRLIREACKGKPRIFLTLTSRIDPQKTPNQAAKELARAWRLVRLRYMRKHRLKALPFIAVFERTKNGWPHLHILLRSKAIRRSDISNWMDELTNSPVVDVRRIHSIKEVAGYVAKYIGKDPHKFGTAKRYWQSKDYKVANDNYEAPDRNVSGDWQLWANCLNTIARDFQDLGYLVSWESKNVCKARPPPDGRYTPMW